MTQWFYLERLPGFYLAAYLLLRRSNQSILRKSTLNIHWKDWCWSWSSNTLATWWEELAHWKRCWCWERLRAGGEGDDRGWDGWLASSTQWTWVSKLWEIGQGSLACMGSQRGGHNWATEQQQISYSGFPGGSDGKEFNCNAGDPGSIPEKEMATHSSIPAWKIPWMGTLVSYNPWGHKESDTTKWLTHASL